MARQDEFSVPLPAPLGSTGPVPVPEAAAAQPQPVVSAAAAAATTNATTNDTAAAVDLAAIAGIAGKEPAKKIRKKQTCQFVNKDGNSARSTSKTTPITAAPTGAR